MLWELVFMLVILKLPVVYLCAVVWYAIKAVPDALEGTDGAPERNEPRPWRPWHAWRDRLGPRPRRGGPHGSPSRSYARSARAARPAAAEKKR